MNVFISHEDLALHPHEGGDGGGGHPVLSGAGLGDDPFLPHPPRQQPLADGVVHLVRAGMVQVFPLQVNLGPPQLAGELFGEVERIRPPHVLAEIVVELLLELPVASVVTVRLLQLQQRRHESFRHVSAAKLTEVPVLVGKPHADSSGDGNRI